MPPQLAVLASFLNTGDPAAAHDELATDGRRGALAGSPTPRPARHAVRRARPSATDRSARGARPAGRRQRRWHGRPPGRYHAQRCRAADPPGRPAPSSRRLPAHRGRAGRRPADRRPAAARDDRHDRSALGAPQALRQSGLWPRLLRLVAQPLGSLVLDGDLRQPHEGPRLSPRTAAAATGRAVSHARRSCQLHGPKCSESAIYEALKNVQEPELGRDIVSLNMVKDVEISDSRRSPSRSS